MAELDLSLTDALTDRVPQPDQETLVEKDFVAQLEAETFDDQVGETVGKTDYTPLLDNDDTRADVGTTLENGEQEDHGVQQPGCKLTAGGQTSALRPEPQGEVWPRSLDQQQCLATVFLSDSMAGYSDPLGSQTNPAQMMDSGRMGGFSGGNVESVPLSAERFPSIVEPQHPTCPAVSNAPKEPHSPMLPEPQAPRSPLDLSTGALSNCWPDQAGCLPTDLPFTPSVSTVISRHAGHLAVRPDDPPDSWPSRENTAYAGGDEREGDGSDRKQKKKKKRRQKDEGSSDHLESRGLPEVQAKGENTPSAEEIYHRMCPRWERGDCGWEEQLGKSGGRGKRGKSRKKLPEQWGIMPELFVPVSRVTSQITEEMMTDLRSSIQANLEASSSDIDTSQSPRKKEVYPEEGLVPYPLSQDLFSPTAPSINPLVLNSELKATAASFTMPSTTNSATICSFGMAPGPVDPFDILMDTENANLGHSSQGFSLPFSPENEATSGDIVDSGMFDNTSSLQEFCVHDIPEGDTSAFSPTSQPSLSPKSKVLASAPPLSRSDASWLLNDSHMSINSEPFDLSDMSTSCHPLTLRLSLDTSSPAPLRSPKTTAQEFQIKEHKDAKLAQKQFKKSRSPSSSEKSPTSPGAKKFSPQASPVISPSSPSSVTPLGIQGSGLNPAAKPFFPSFADPKEPAMVPPVTPIIKVTSDTMEKAEKEEKLEDNVKKFDPLDKAELKSAEVEYTSSETPAKMEKETQKDEEKETQKVKVTEKPEENVEEKKGKEKVQDTEKVESMQQKAEKEDKIYKVEESPDKLVKTDKVDKTEKVEKVEMTEKVESKVEKTENVEKVDNNEESGVEEITQNKHSVKLDKSEMNDGKEQHMDKVEKTSEQQLTPTLVTIYDKLEKKADRETKTTAEMEETKKEKAKKTEKEDEVEKPSEKPAEQQTQKSEKEEKQDKMQADKKIVQKKDDKKDKAAKADGGEKAKKVKPTTNGSIAILSRDLASAEKKAKDAAGATKLSAAAKMRSSPIAAGGSVTAPTKRPTPSTTNFTSDKKPTTAKASSTTAAGPKWPCTTYSSRPASSTTITKHDVKSKTTIEKCHLVPKASIAKSNQVGSTAATKTGSAITAASKTATSVRTTGSTRTITTTAAKKPLASKTDSKPGEEKKPSTLKTFTADSTKPKTTTTTRSSASMIAASRNRTTAAKPATPSSTAGTLSEKKPPVPRASRANSSTTTTTTTSRTTARPGTAPAPDIRNTRSKNVSTDNMKHQPGGKVSSATQSRGVTSKETRQGKVQILNKKVDLSKVTSKCGSKDNIKHKPGGGDVKIESHKVSFREKAQSKVGFMDNVSHSPGGGNIKAEGAQEMTEGNGTTLSGTAAPAPGSEPQQAGSPAAQENGLKEGASCDSKALQEPQALDSQIPETK